jgi:formylglycine-generating enzyme required for sulfatase activity
MKSIIARRISFLSASLALSALLVVAFAADGRAVTINTVPVGNAGNAGELSGAGAGGFGPDAIVGGVAYDYRIGTTEVTNAQYVEFLNAVADMDTNGLYNTSMGSETRGGIMRSGSSPNFSYSVKPDAFGYTYADKPVIYVSWYDTLRFANWLHNGQPSGLQVASTTEDGAYTFSGATSVGARNTGAIWFLPSEDEWYKAAYYDGSTYNDYPTGTDTPPDNNLPSSDSGNSANFWDNGYTTGTKSYPMTDAGAYMLSASPYGTFDQGGNVFEWNETLVSDSSRGIRGGSWWAGLGALAGTFRGFSDPRVEFDNNIDIGFRMATVPEPGTAILAIVACGLMWVLRKRFK